MAVQTMTWARSGGASLVVEFDNVTGAVAAMSCQNAPQRGAQANVSGPLARQVNFVTGPTVRIALAVGLVLTKEDGAWRLPAGAMLGFRAG